MKAAVFISFVLLLPFLHAMDKFHIFEGDQHNYFLRSSDVSLHLLLKNTPKPRLLVAFPEANAGIGVWLANSSMELPSLQNLSVYREGNFRGVRFTLRLQGQQVRLSKILLNNIRILRDFVHHGRCPQDQVVADFMKIVAKLDEEQQQKIAAAGVSLESVSQWLSPVIAKSEKGVEWRRATLDGKNNYFLGLYPKSAAQITTGASCAITSEQEEIWLDVVAAVDFSPYHRPQEGILNRHSHALYQQLATEDPALFKNLTVLLRNLSFLSFREKVMAGSWRFLTYFGRDSIMSLRMLRPVVSANFFENITLSVLERVNPEGEVAHEEDIGDQAMIRRLSQFCQRYGERDFAQAVAELANFSAPIYDYKMIDDNFMLPAMIAEYLRDTSIPQQSKTAFWQRKTSSGATAREKILRNIDYVLRHRDSWVALRKGETVGDWRDSEAGLAYGRYPFSVNGALVPMALYAINTILSMEDSQQLLSDSRTMGLAALQQVLEDKVDLLAEHQKWEQRRQQFLVQYTEQQAPSAVASKGAIQFHALVLDDQQKPIPIMHSDTAFLLFQSLYTPTDWETLLLPFQLPYPNGLWTEAGPLVANPGYANDKFYAMFDKHQYHGTVVWSWHISLLELGLIQQYRLIHQQWQQTKEPKQAQQLRMLKSHLTRLFQWEQKMTAWRASELWSWQRGAKGIEAVAFGSGKDVTESNALQLWSCVALASWLEYKRWQQEYAGDSFD